MTFAAGVAWFVVNQVYTIGGVGLLARQDWPLSDYRIALAAGAALGLVGGVVTRAGRRRRARQMAARAMALGLAYDAEVRRRGKEVMPLFEHWSVGCNRLHGTYRGVAVELFDLTSNEPGDEGSVTTHKTVVLLPADGLPAFDLRPRPPFLSLLRMPPLPGEVTFDAGSTPDPAARDVVARFVGRFWLKATEEDAAAVRRLFGPRVMEVLNGLSGWSVQSHGGRLALVCGRGHRPAAALAEVLAAALTIRATLLRGGTAAGAGVRALQPVAVARLEGRAIATILGGMAGVLVGFIFGSAGGSSVFFSSPPSQGLGPKFFLQPLIFFGSVFAGGALGALVGARLPVRRLTPLVERTPEEIARRKKRHTTVAVGAVAGSFVGFFAGGFLHMFTRHVLDAGAARPGLQHLHFFGLIWGGALVGACLGGFAANGLASAWERRAAERGSRPVPASGSAGPASGLYAAALLLFGVCFTAIGGVMGGFSVVALIGTERCPGTVASLTDNSEDSQAPNVRYEAAGQAWVIQGKVRTSPAAYSVGEPVTVAYHPDDPGAGRIDSFTELWLIPLIFGGIGVAALAGARGVVASARRRALAGGS
jgi:hypothetical protein